MLLNIRWPSIFDSVFLDVSCLVFQIKTLGLDHYKTFLSMFLETSSLVKVSA